MKKAPDFHKENAGATLVGVPSIIDPSCGAGKHPLRKFRSAHATHCIDRLNAATQGIQTLVASAAADGRIFPMAVRVDADSAAHKHMEQAAMQAGRMARGQE